MPRHRLLVVAGLLGSGACSLLAPSDDDLLGGAGARDAASDARDGASDALIKPDQSNPDAPSGDAPDVSSDAMADAITDAPGDVSDAEPGADGPRTCTDGGSCGRGDYCGPLGLCTPCSDITRLDLSEIEFGAPEPLTRVTQAAAGSSVRYPRAFDSMTDLVYQREVFLTATLWLTTDLFVSAGSALPPTLGVSSFTEGAALKVRSAAGALAAHNFFFQRKLPYADGADGDRVELYGTRYASGSFGTVERLPPPFNADGRDSFSLALSARRAVWVVNHGGIDTRIMTADLANATMTAREMSIEDANGCAIRELDWSPWLTADGKLMFFNTRPMDASCTPQTQYADAIYAVRLDESGEDMGPARPLRGIDSTGAELDGSLSIDLCWFYFTGAPAATGQPLTARRARRLR